MAFNLDIETHGNNHQGKGGVATVAGKSNAVIADLAGASAAPFRFVVTGADVQAGAGVPAGIYERTGTAASGNPIYAPSNRNH